MNRTGSILITAVAVVLFTALLTDGWGSGKVIRLSGRVIDAAADFIEIKKSSRETRVFYTESTSIFKIDGSKGERSDIELCQRVEVVYSFRDGRNMLRQVKILTESDCVQ